MPVHDWAPDKEWIFWDLRMSWLVHLTHRLNGGVLPTGYFAMLDVQRPDPNDRPERRIHIHSSLTDVVAAVDIVSPRDKQDAGRVGAFATKVAELVRAGRHVVVIDILPPTPAAPSGMHPVIWERLSGSGAFRPPDETPLTIASYEAGEDVAAYVDFTAVGRPIPNMPLFLASGRYVTLPLDETYAGVIDRYPPVVRDQIG
jgi:hypothetical protein